MRAVWLLILFFAIGLVLSGVKPRFSTLSQPCNPPDCAQSQLTIGTESILIEGGLSTSFYAGAMIAVDLLLVLGHIVIGGIIYWRKSTDKVAYFISVWLITNGVGIIPTLDSASEASPWGRAAVIAVRLIGWTSVYIFLYIFPDGRFVPAWNRYTVALSGIFTFFLLLSVEDIFSFVPSNPGQLFWLVGTFLFTGIGIGSQIYRYARVSGPVLRQQTKWVVFGAVVIFIIYFGLILLEFFLDPTHRSAQERFVFSVALSWVRSMTFFVPPVAIAFAVFRYRLWDIDLLIRRTLSYTILTVSLAVVYYFGIVTTQVLITRLSGTVDSQVGVVVSTLLIAALFNPLRRLVQVTIDRRFYRLKYDAEQTLDRFASTARQEVDLTRLSAAIVLVAQETLRPEKLNLMLKPDP